MKCTVKKEELFVVAMGQTVDSFCSIYLQVTWNELNTCICMQPRVNITYQQTAKAPPRFSSIAVGTKVNG